MYDYNLEFEDRELKAVGLELMFMTPEKGAVENWITAVELAKMVELPVDTVKIDREYVKDVEKSKADQSTVRFISDLADAFSAEVCVEGVETEEMKDFLKQYKVSSLQGYYYSKPVPSDEFLEMDFVAG